MLSGYEAGFILLIAIFLFGSKKIPELAKSLGESIKIFNKASKDIDETTKQLKEDVKS